MRKVESSNIDAIGWTPEHGLKVQFKDKAGNPGNVYHYADVPESVHAALMAADSHGKHFLAHIRNNYQAIQQ